MAEYHLWCSPLTNTIYAGTLNKAKTMWQNKSDVTEEALVCVRDHLFQLAKDKGKQEGGYEWTLKDGRRVQLLVKIMPKEGSDAG
jgi:hypothetical protein